MGGNITGKLGHRLGTIVDVRCKGIAEPTGKTTKDAFWTHMVDVIAVNGKALSAPVRLDFSSLPSAPVEKPAAGQTVDLVAYEHGRYVGIPDGAFKHIPAITTTPYHFETQLVALRKK